MRALILALAFVASCGGWTRADTLGELAFLVPTTLDETQTQTITYHCAESNPIIGECGQRVAVGNYFFGALVIHAVVSAALPPGARTWWQALTVGGELATVWKNYGDGISP